MAAGTFNKTTINHNSFISIRSKQCFEIVFGHPTGLFYVPTLHNRYGKEELFGPGYMAFFIARFVWHGIHYDHIFASINPIFKFFCGYDGIAAAFCFTQQLDSTGLFFYFFFKLVFCHCRADQDQCH